MTLAKLFICMLLITLVSADQVCMEQGSYAGAIIGSIIGGLVLGMLIVLIILCCCCGWNKMNVFPA